MFEDTDNELMCEGLLVSSKNLVRICRFTVKSIYSCIRDLKFELCFQCSP